MPARQLTQPAARIVKLDQHIQANQGGIYIPDVPAGGSDPVSEDNICMNALTEYENHELAYTASTG